MTRLQALPALATAGIVGPIVFTVGLLVQPLFRRGEYNATAEVISDLEAGPGGWVQQVNFVVFGLLMIAFAVGLHRGVGPAPAAAGPAILTFNAWLGLAQRAVLAIWLLLHRRSRAETAACRGCGKDGDPR